MMIRAAILFICLGALPASAQQPARSEEASARFPQPVQVGQLTGRQVLENRLNQRVLGHVEGLSRAADGALRITVLRRGWPWQSRRCAELPLSAVALLGQFVVVMDLDDAQLEALPNQCQAGVALLPASTAVRVGLTKN